MQRVLLIITVCLALGFVGCGDSSTTAGGGETASAQEKAETIEQEYREQEEVEAKKAKKEEAEVRKATEKEAAALPKPNIPSGPPPKKLLIKEVKEGSGATAKDGDEVAIHYVGVLYDSGKLFAANWKDDAPVPINLNEKTVLKPWYRSVLGMRVGGRREVIAPPRFAYGSRGGDPSIPPNATLVILLELVWVKSG